MAIVSRRPQNVVNVWPGYVDVLSALLMVVIFVLLIFILAQFIMSEILRGRESELDTMRNEVVRLGELLGLEKNKNQGMSQRIEGLSALVQTLTGEKDALQQEANRYLVRAERTEKELRQQVRLTSSLEEDITALKKVRSRLEKEVSNLADSLQRNSQELISVRDRSKKLEAELANKQEQTILAQKEIQNKEIRLQALNAIIGKKDHEIANARELNVEASAKILLLSRQIEGLKNQLNEISQVLAKAESQERDQKATIVNLGKRLNIALAHQINDLEQYRSDFFGRLRQALGQTEGIVIKGDRFVFQAELLFDSGSATLGPAGKSHLKKLAQSLLSISNTIPRDIPWILRIDGHTDRTPIRTVQYASNWELSTARALSVVHFLISQGIPAQRLAATGMSKFHPIDLTDTAESLRRNRRIEIKFTSR